MSYPSDETIRMLRNVRDYAYTIWVRSQWLVADLDVLQQRPDWDTAAEEELTQTLEKLSLARAAVMRAIVTLKERPIEPRHCRLCDGPLPCLTHREGDVPCLT